MSRIEILTNISLLDAAICLWSSSLNVFIFRSGPKIITLYDLAILLGLKPHSMEIDLAFSIVTTAFDSIIIKSKDYGLSIKSYFNEKDEVSQAEHMAFLLTWLNKFVSCNRSKKV